MHTLKTTSGGAHEQPPLQPVMLSVPQTAHLLGIGLTLCWEMVYSGELPSVRFGRRVLVPREAVERLAHVDESEPPPH